MLSIDTTLDLLTNLIYVFKMKKIIFLAFIIPQSVFAQNVDPATALKNHFQEQQLNPNLPYSLPGSSANPNFNIMSLPKGLPDSSAEHQELSSNIPSFPKIDPYSSLTKLKIDALESYSFNEEPIKQSDSGRILSKSERFEQKRLAKLEAYYKRHPESRERHAKLNKIN